MHIIPFNIYEFRENQYSESHAVLWGVNDVLLVFCVFCIRYWKQFGAGIYELRENLRTD